MTRRTLRLALVGGTLATVTMMSGGIAMAADYTTGGGGGGTSTPGSTGTSGSGTSGSGTSSGDSGTTTSSDGGTVSSGGSGTSDSGDSLPFTGIEVVSVLTVGAGAIGVGTVLVAAGRRRRDSGALV